MPETPEKTRRIARNLLLLLIPACLGAAAVFFLYQTYPDLDYWKGFFDEGREYLEAHPWALILVLATLPGLGFPLSPILILFGIVLLDSGLEDDTRLARIGPRTLQLTCNERFPN